MWLYLLHEKIGVPEQALGWFPLGLGLVVEDKPSKLSLRSWGGSWGTMT